jgi:hypothetical protein
MLLSTTTYHSDLMLNDFDFGFGYLKYLPTGGYLLDFGNTKFPPATSAFRSVMNDYLVGLLRPFQSLPLMPELSALIIPFWFRNNTLFG